MSPDSRSHEAPESGSCTCPVSRPFFLAGARGCFVAFLLAVLPAGLAGQSLGEVAAREQKKKEGQKPRPVRVYTEDDLKRAKEAGTSAVTVLGSASSESAPTDPEEGPDETKQRRDTWRSRAEAARGAVLAAEERIRETQARIDALTLDAQPNPDDILDPNRVQKREAERQKALKDLATAKEELAAAKKAYEDLEREARGQHVPPGWLEP